MATPPNQGPAGPQAGQPMPGPMPGPGGPMPPPLRPGQQPTQEQIAFMQRQLAAEAQKHGMTVPQYVEQLKAQAMRQQQMMQQQAAQQQAAQQGGPPPQQGQPRPMPPGAQPVQPGPPTPQAIAVANFLRSQDLKPRTCIFNEKRKDMFRVKRAIRALHSEAYQKARAKNNLLPPVTDRATAENAFKLLPLSLLALRVTKIDPHEGHAHGKKKRVKGLWTVKVEQQQNADDDSHYVWLYEGPQWKQKLYAVLALIAVFAVVMFPLWPLVMRQGVWYLSMGMLGLIGLFFAMAIFRLILFCITVFIVPPGLWLYPNLFEDVGFFDSFRPVWAWQETEEDKKKAKEAKKAKKAERVEKKKAKEAAAHSHNHPHNHAHAHGPTPTAAPAPAAPAQEEPAAAPEAPVDGAPAATGVEQPAGEVRQRMQASVEEADEE
ncbi:Translocation protein SEC62 [Lasiodiplodia hormozganensis]|uniref:Translocation protein SEC62 n=1 Tax=Lasiodiplodia hormozganensis TaxID=869390 RepID=A0AA39YVL6_9PEZI|nr:Translocation protein SEC62 [Lasiodiplodia hormozganensis]